MDQISRIQKSRNFYAVLGIEKVGIYESQVIRKYYKSQALSVHPDKNKLKGAEEAFKKVSHAFEKLATEALQRKYLTAIGKKHLINKRPRDDLSEDIEIDVDNLPKKNPKSAQEVWEAFEKEEEEFLRKQYMKKSKHEGTKKNSIEKKPIHTEEEVETVLRESNSKKVKWNCWNKQSKKNIAMSEDHKVGEESNYEDKVEDVGYCCLLCRRKFNSDTHLKKHEQFSKLHLQNLQNKQILRG